MAAAQPAGLPRGVEAFARAAQRVEDFSHAIVASHRPPGGDPAFHRATISHQPHCHVQNQLLDSSPLLLAPDDELGVPPPEKLLLESSDEPDELLGEPEDDELLDRPDELGALLLDELLGGGGGGGGGDEPLDEEPESLDQDAPGLLDDPLEPEALVPELLDEDGRPPEELLSGPDDDELLCPLLLEPLLELEELPKALDEGPLLEELLEELPDEEDDRPDELPLEELLPDDESDEEPDELSEEELDEPLLDEDPEEPLDEDELELPLDELLEDGGQTV